MFDERLDRVLLVNGVAEAQVDPQPLELWTWDGSTWSLVAADPDGPVGRNFAAVAYDSRREVLVVHGGQTAGETYGDTLEWDGTSWQTFPGDPGGPGPRSAPAMAYDATAEVAVLYGGDSAEGQVYGDTWTWDGTTWTQVAQDGPQPPRWPAMFAFDPAREQIVLFGGHQVVDPAGPPSVADTWIWDGSDWRLAEADAAPGALVNASGVYDPALDRLVLVGGSDMVDTSGDTWTWTGATWDRLVADALPARQGFGLAYDESRDVIVMTGGVVAPGQPERYQDVWEWTGVGSAEQRHNP